MEPLIIQVAALIAAAIMLYIMLKLLKGLIELAINSIGSLLLLFVLNMVLGLGVDINIFSILIVALAGLPGLFLVLILHFLGLAF